MKKSKMALRIGIVLAVWGALSIPALSGLTVLGGCGGTKTDTGGGGGEAVANAGPDQEVLRGVTVTLDGSASTGVETSLWTFTSRPEGSSAALSGDTTLSPTFTADVVGSYVIQLSVNDGASTDTVTVTAANASVSISVPEGSAIITRERFGVTEYVVNLDQTGAVLSSAGSQFAGLSALSTKDQAGVTYKWEQVFGPGATAEGSTTGETFTFTAPGLVDFFNEADHYKWQPLPVSRNDTKMIFKLTITDAEGTSSDAATFTVFLQDDYQEIHTSSGLPNVGVGTVVYLSGPNLNAAGASATDPALEEGKPITDWSWTLTPPAGSGATFPDTGTTASTLQFPKFVPDVPGIYFVDFSSTTGNTTHANPTVKVPGTLMIHAADYVGVGTIAGASPSNPQCATCHDGSPLSGLEDTVAAWSGTVHATRFENSMDIYAGLAPEPYLWEFHTVGYNKDAISGGFDDLASAAGFTFPVEGLTFSDFASGHPSLAALSNIQCENCHGPGSQHSGDPLRIADSFAQFGTCGQCHVQEDAWKNSGHNSTGVKHGSGNYQNSWVTSVGCVRCHNAKGFEAYLEEGEEGLASMIDDTGAFPGITCAACHNPHDATNPNQLRIAGNVTMIADGSTVDAGKAAVCYTCHDGNYAHNEDDCDTDADGRADALCTTHDETALGYWRGGFHYTPQSPMLEGNQALTDLDGDATDDWVPTENSFHSGPSFTLAAVTGDPSLPAENNKCVTCHMAPGPSPLEEGYQHLGGHAFKLRSGHGLGHLKGGEEPEDIPFEAGELELVSACTVCHSSVTEMNRLARADYDGDGELEGIQDEVRGLLLNLGNFIKALDTDNVNQASGTTETDGVITENTIGWAGTKSSGLTGSNNCTTGTPSGGREVYQPCNFVDADPALRRAVWNYNSVVRDGSLGIHNAAYTIQVLQGTYKALGIVLDGEPASFTYKTDFPAATLR